MPFTCLKTTGGIFPDVRVFRKAAVLFLLRPSVPQFAALLDFFFHVRLVVSAERTALLLPTSFSSSLFVSDPLCLCQWTVAVAACSQLRAQIQAG